MLTLLVGLSRKFPGGLKIEAPMDDVLYSPLSESGRSHSGCAGQRREFLWQMGAGFAGLAMTDLLDRDGFFSGEAQAAGPSFESPLAVHEPQFTPQAKHVIYLFMYGGPSQVDSWDYKPELNKRHGQSIEIETRRRQMTKATLLGSKRKFRQYGESGLWGSDSFPHINEHLDDICVLRSLYADTFAHASALIQLNSGRVVQGSPTLGSWLGYGLGSQNDNLPGYVVMLDPRGGPIAGAANWSSGFMPAAYQGTHLRNKGEPILDLSPREGVTRKMQRDLIDTLGDLNAKHLTQRPGYSQLPARIASYELAYQLQMTAPEAMDISQESQKTQEMYGLFDPTPKEDQCVGSKPFGTQCLVARRLIERGVRYIQIYSGGGHSDQNWDAHGDVEKNLRIHAPEIDRPIAGLLTDLKQRGLLDDTLIVWGGEFGRQSVSQPGNANGRDHNPLGFTYWMAGGGIKGGMTYGETDELGHQATVNRRHIRDLHATILHQMGLDHRKLTYFYGGLDHKLTGVHPAEVISDVIA
jgi:hypothetical protein